MLLISAPIFSYLLAPQSVNHRGLVEMGQFNEVGRRGVVRHVQQVISASLDTQVVVIVLRLAVIVVDPRARSC
jgi:hypothetical protein